MKLQYQLNTAFTLLLIVILTVTGFVIHSLILDLLIKDEAKQLEQKGEILVTILTEDEMQPNIHQFSEFLHEQDLQLFLYDRRKDRVLFSTLSDRVVQGFINNKNFTKKDDVLWEYRNNKFVTSKIHFYPSSSGLELILLTPLTDLQAVQSEFIIRLLIVFVIGAIAAVILSYILTRKLVTPLTSLKKQLKKIEKRQFDDIERVEATGEIKEVEQSVYDMATELQRYMETQQTFFQNASHELKTPLMTIQGYAEGIRDRVFDEKDSEKGLEVMVTEVKRLKKIINEMILLAKLESEEIEEEVKRVVVLNIIEQVTDRTLPLSSEKDIYIETDIDPSVELMINEEKLLRALLNIMVNGIRYAEAIVRITVTQKKKLVVIHIEDDGEGIVEDLIPHIFHRFVKGNNGQTGLGLAISRAIVEKNGGKITVTKSDLGGAKFIIHFPLE